MSSLHPGPQALTVLKTGKVESEDDWTGLGDAKERRKRQNRLNQRAFRQRKRVERHNAGLQQRIEEMIMNGEVTLLPTAPESSVSPGSEISMSSMVQQLFEDRLNKLLEQLSQNACERYAVGSPSADQLLTLCKLNVFRAFASNMLVLGMTPAFEWMHDDAISPFNTMQPGVVEGEKLPVSLRPTPLQRTQSHHPWMDCFPFPKLRDNLIAAGDFDDDPLCRDIMGVWDTPSESSGLMVWGEPSNAENWEVSEKFLRKWPWVVAGCPELLQSTNRWRSKRGEKMIFRYL
ncbi:hypothetical protein ARAM_001701 [Aspergillus rambellii]|uniref:BZIP domain-containing protein n=1 Tax=Aspergillus rambellii TaxID=308745 RepID=A0A0F8UQA4_9EURO|nr:hypothetical protein ARAM_001701 [Aspergillus rambellii]